MTRPVTTETAKARIVRALELLDAARDESAFSLADVEEALDVIGFAAAIAARLADELSVKIANPSAARRTRNLAALFAIADGQAEAAADDLRGPLN